MSSPDEMEVIDKKVKAFCRDLLEHHLVNIRVVITREVAADTKLYTHYAGDYYATMGAMQRLIVREEEQARVCIRAENEEPTEPT